MTASMIEQDLQISAARQLDKIAQREHARILALGAVESGLPNHSRSSGSGLLNALVAAIRNLRPLSTRPVTP